MGNQYAIGNKGGHPLFYKTIEEMQLKIDEYFRECEGRPLLDAEGRVRLSKYDEPIYIGCKPLTITGLALHLGFNSRQALLNYQDKNEFNDTIVRAKAFVEQYAESRLFDKDGNAGARFSLANNFKGWADKQQVESINTNLNYEIPTTEDEIDKRISELINKTVK